MARANVIRLTLLVIFTGALTGCDFFSSDPGYFTWKLNGVEKKTYKMKILGTAILTKDLFGLDQYRLTRENIPVTLSVKNESFIVVNKKDSAHLNVQLVSGKSTLSSFPDLSNSSYAQQAFYEMFPQKSGIELFKVELAPKGLTQNGNMNRFLSLNIYMRLPDDSLLQEKKGGLPSLDRLKNEEMCIDLYNRKIKDRETTTSVILNKVNKNQNGDIVAEMDYHIVEKIVTEYEEGDFAKRRFIKRFNDANIFTEKKLKLDDDDEQKTYLCEYNGKHFFNITKGWLERVEAEQSIQMIKTDYTVKAAEIFRMKTIIIPVNEEISVMDSIDYVMSEDENDEQNKKKQARPTITEMLDPLDGGFQENIVPPKSKKIKKGNELPK
ncbi:MAG: hypothetical protein KDI61_07430 [Alphaproteobacteria bacterium]|nr:hypothetical protein [Alphaproteobacteria bacterium]